MVAPRKPVILVDVDPGNIFSNFLRMFARKNRDLSFSMGEAVRIVKKGSTANFILKGSGKYVPLSPEYAKRKAALAPGAPILVGPKESGGISGIMRDSILKTTPDSVIRVGKLSAEVGTKAKTRKGFPYPIAVHGGTSKMPARPVIFITDKMEKMIMKTIDAEIATNWEK
jgi:hypothetical protein